VSAMGRRSLDRVFQHIRKLAAVQIARDAGDW
jgi:hypothetical protein